ncbi:MAG: hypothetical protein M0R21_08675 [Lentimicrobiaceae bacterium]|nr:hypothetical protein [Lentimicrobiaceae bacterium]
MAAVELFFICCIKLLLSRLSCICPDSHRDHSEYRWNCISAIGFIKNTILAGEFAYQQGKPHAVQTVSGPANMDPLPQITTISSFTADNKINYENRKLQIF